MVSSHAFVAVVVVVAVACLARVGTSFVAVPSTTTTPPTSRNSILANRRAATTTTFTGVSSATATNNSKNNNWRIQRRFQQQASVRLRMTGDNNKHGNEEDKVVATTIPTIPSPRHHHEVRPRRGFLGDAARSAAALAACTAWAGTGTGSFVGSAAANAAMKSDQKVFAVGKDLTVDEAKARFREGRDSLEYLLEHYDEICDGGGDNIRRYLGTVGTTSGLYGISKVLKILLEDASDVVEFRETMEDINAALVGADGSAYMSIFTESSTSGVPKEKYFGDAKIEVKRAIAAMKDLAKQIDGGR